MDPFIVAKPSNLREVALNFVDLSALVENRIMIEIVTELQILSLIR
jgi:hypothetical protein